MSYLTPLAKMLIPCCLLAACASVPEVPPLSRMHPAHPEAAAARVAGRSSVLEEMAMATAPQRDAMDMGEMDHSGHTMSMDDDEQDGMDHPGHTMNMDDDEQDGMDHPGRTMSMDDDEQDGMDHSGHTMSMDDAADSEPPNQGGDDEG